MKPLWTRNNKEVAHVAVSRLQLTWKLSSEHIFQPSVVSVPVHLCWPWDDILPLHMLILKKMLEEAFVLKIIACSLRLFR